MDIDEWGPTLERKDPYILNAQHVLNEAGRITIIDYPDDYLVIERNDQYSLRVDGSGVLIRDLALGSDMRISRW